MTSALLSLSPELIFRIFDFLLYSISNRNLLTFTNDVMELCKLDLICKEFSMNTNYRNYVENNYWKPLVLCLSGFSESQITMMKTLTMTTNERNLLQQENNFNLIEPDVMNMLSKRTYKKCFAIMNRFLNRQVHQQRFHTLDRKAPSLLVLGPEGVGKTCIIRRIVQNRFDEYYDPPLDDSFEKLLTINGLNFKVTLYDDTSRYDYGNMTEHYIRKCTSFIIVCDVHRRESLEDACYFIRKVFRIHDDENVPILFMINKMDQVLHGATTRTCSNVATMVMTTDRVEEELKSIGALNYEIVETSAKMNNSNIDEPLKRLIQRNCQYLPDYVKSERKKIIENDCNTWNESVEEFKS
ncbi:hypothetical protein FDP41_011107 [Naegleria fowleri]|uniref:Uncharacterized protein n=1 Tax=Naegleria fowleri TaxID=5763 RepID=A0A6A5CCX2_NAEFO|nr:uncharacterized protein FDP41_011107 [Naegleria fowleri]KAF0983129.1 hypothetical protein FDP41_011107 [Naegleria fowleri]